MALSFKKKDQTPFIDQDDEDDDNDINNYNNNS